MGKVSVRKAVTAALEALMEDNRRIWVVATDSRGSVTASDIARKFPGRFVELGIAEQNAVTFAAGLASTGRTVFAAGPASFLAARSYEQVKVDVAYAESDVKILGVSAGVSYGPLGGTHTALHDFAGMRALPNIEVFAPSDAVQAGAITRNVAASGLPAYIRTGRGDVEGIYPEDETFEPHRAKTVREGSDVTLVACGEMVAAALGAAGILQSEGISARVLGQFCLKPADPEPIIEAARGTGAVVTAEEHSIHGGLGELVCAVTAAHCPVPVAVMGFPDEEYLIGKNHELFAAYNLTPRGIADKAREVMGRKICR